MENTGGTEEKNLTLRDRILEILEIILKICIVIVLFKAMEYATAYSMIYAGFKLSKYIGSYALISAVLSSVIFFFCSKVEGRIATGKKSHLIRLNMITLKECIFAVVIAFALLAVVAAYLLVNDRLAEYFTPVEEAMSDYSEAMETYDEDEDYPLWDQIIYVIAITFAVPVSEEFAFRGLIYGAVNRRFNAFWSIAVSSVVFGIMHGISIHIIYALVSGIILGITYYAFDSIYMTIIAHGLFNFFGSGIYNLADCFKIDRGAVPGFFTVQFAMLLPAGMILVMKSKERHRMNLAVTAGEVINEPA